VGDLNPRDRQLVAEFRARHGIVGGGLAGTRLLLLHHVGARSGAERITPLAWWPVTDRAVTVLASNFGAQRHPRWYHNVIANPAATAEIGGDTWAVKATVATPEERNRLLGPIMAETPSAAAAVRNTSREIPVVILHLIDKKP